MHARVSLCRLAVFSHTMPKRKLLEQHIDHVTNATGENGE